MLNSAPESLLGRINTSSEELRELLNEQIPLASAI